MRSKILKDAIVDGYFKTFDLGNQYSIGRAKYKDLDVTDMLFYFKWIGISMTVTFLLMLSLIGGLMYVATNGNEFLMYILFGLYLAIIAPMILFGFSTIRGWLR